MKTAVFFAFKVMPMMPTVIFFSALVSLLYDAEMLQQGVIAAVMQHRMKQPS